MASQTTIKAVHGCGCEGDITIYYKNNSDLDSQTKYRSKKALDQTCQSCKSGVSIVKAQEAVSITLPALEGSEKQVKWATDIRASFILKALPILRQDAEETVGIKRFDAFIEDFLTIITDAGEWIEWRDESELDRKLEKMGKEILDRHFAEERGVAVVKEEQEPVVIDVEAAMLPTSINSLRDIQVVKGFVETVGKGPLLKGKPIKTAVWGTMDDDEVAEWDAELEYMYDYAEQLA